MCLCRKISAQQRTGRFTDDLGSAETATPTIPAENGLLLLEGRHASRITIAFGEAFWSSHDPVHLDRKFAHDSTSVSPDLWQVCSRNHARGKVIAPQKQSIRCAIQKFGGKAELRNGLE
jgi:hypothetical protein